MRTRHGSFTVEAPNVRSVLFKEHEGSFLVGFIAGTLTQTGVVGFVGGMDIPLIRNFNTGYEQGVLNACPNCTVISNYVGVTPTAWNDPARAKELATNQQAQGADIIYAAACSGAQPLFFIGVDRNQNPLGDIGGNATTLNHGLTSMLKRVDVAAYDAILDVVAGTFTPGLLRRQRLRVSWHAVGPRPSLRPTIW